MKKEHLIGAMKTSDKHVPTQKPSPQLKIARSADSFDLLEFPFASSAFILLMACLMLIGRRSILTNESMAAAACFLTLVG